MSHVASDNFACCDFSTFHRENRTASTAEIASGLWAFITLPGDIGIENDPTVLFAENFERGTLEEIAKKWGNISNKDGKVMSFSNDVPPESSGKRSLQMTATLG